MKLRYLTLLALIGSHSGTSSGKDLPANSRSGKCIAQNPRSVLRMRHRIINMSLTLRNQTLLKKAAPKRLLKLHGSFKHFQLGSG